MGKESSNKILTKYLDLMMEIRRREEVIICFHEEHCNAKYLIVNHEIIFFQLRKILEIIAKSPIIMNEEKYRLVSKKAEHDWRIKDIIKKLKMSNPNYYPNPVYYAEKDMDEIVNRTEGHLTEEELIEAYDYCSDFLHSDNPLKPKKNTNFDKEWLWVVHIMNKIHLLLNFHTFYPERGDMFYHISMDNGSGKPVGSEFTKLDQK